MWQRFRVWLHAYYRLRFQPHFGTVVTYWPGRRLYYDSTRGTRWLQE